MASYIQTGNLMNAQQFAEQLNRIAGTAVGELVKRGLSKRDARMIADMYKCKPREKPLLLEDEGNQILMLMKYWNVSKLEIGMVRFQEGPVESKDGLQIGEVEADPLILSLETRQTIVEELGTDGHVLWTVAHDDTGFLDALAKAAGFLRERTDLADTTTARRVATECASLAGGQDYLDFYLMLLGGE
jgi:hypothetical protein